MTVSPANVASAVEAGTPAPPSPPALGDLDWTLGDVGFPSTLVHGNFTEDQGSFGDSPNGWQPDPGFSTWTATAGDQKCKLTISPTRRLILDATLLPPNGIDPYPANAYALQLGVDSGTCALNVTEGTPYAAAGQMVLGWGITSGSSQAAFFPMPTDAYTVRVVFQVDKTDRYVDGVLLVSDTDNPSPPLDFEWSNLSFDADSGFIQAVHAFVETY